MPEKTCEQTITRQEDVLGLSVLTEAVLAFFGLRVISSAPSGDGGIYFLFGAFLAVVAILAMTLYVSVVGIPAF